MQLILPNWHVILIHYPLGFLAAGILIELFSFLWRTSSFRTAGRWMILLGALLSIPTATAGLYAFRDVVGGTDYKSWADRQAAASHLTGEQWHHLTDHLWLNVAATIIFVVAVVVWIGASNLWRQRLHWPLIALLVVGMGLVTVGAWHGGEMVYRHGVAVRAAGSPAATAPRGAEDHHAGDDVKGIERLIDPMEAHLILAGLTIALAAAAIGVSFRSIAEARQALAAQTDEIPPPEVPSPGVAEFERRDHLASDDHIAHAIGGETRLVIPPPAYPPARFWLLTTLSAVLTALGGLWLADAWTPEDLREIVTWGTREGAHGILGSSIIVLSLILAGLARWTRRQPILLSVFAGLLLLVVAGQIWMGVLLAFDGHEGESGRWWRLQPATPAVTPQAPTAPDMPPVTPVTAPATMPAPATKTVPATKMMPATRAAPAKRSAPATNTAPATMPAGQLD